jgi:predicted permease
VPDDRWLRDRFRHLPAKAEVDEELAAHIELQVHRYVAAGMSEPDARAAALARFGDMEPVREECRAIRVALEKDVRRLELRRDLRTDVSFALRTLTRARLFTAVAVLTIALGVGAATTIFSALHAVLLEPLPYSHADRTIVIGNRYQPEEGPGAVSPPEFFDVGAQLRAADATAALRPRPLAISGDGADPERLSGYFVSPNLFDLLGARPLIGRTFRPDDGAPGAAPVVVLSHGLWLRRFGGDSALVGRDVRIDAQTYQVIGVMPPGVRFPDAGLSYLREPADVWLPDALESVRAEERGNQYLVAVARLRDGVTSDQARAELAAIESRFRADFPERYAPPAVPGWGLASRSLREELVGDARPMLLLLAGAVGLLLLLACANVANLLLARAAGRERELALRVALGASRWRVVRQLLTESTVLALLGGLGGVLLAQLGTRALVALDGGAIPRLAEMRVSASVLAFSFAASLVTGLLVGLLPALRSSRADLRGALGDGNRASSDGMGRGRVRDSLVAAQLAVALVLLVCAGLLGRSLLALQRVEPGFSPNGVLTLQVSTPRVLFDSAAKVRRFYTELQRRAGELPGVTTASAVYPLPMSGEQWSGSYAIEGEPAGPGVEIPNTEYSVVLPGYFRALGIPLLEGRDFADTDTRESPPVVIVDEDLARRHWPGESAVGKRLHPGGPVTPLATVIGVVGHVWHDEPGERGGAQMYRPHQQHAERTLTLVLRSDGETTPLVPVVRQLVTELHADLPIARVADMRDLVAAATARPRFNTLVLAAFAISALVLASVGLYGVMALAVTQRRREFGVRLALGARPSAVHRMVLRKALAISAAGIAAGAALALALSRSIASLLHGVSPTDAPTWLGIVLLLLAVAMAAAYGPARRATRVDPAVALRE